MEAQTPYLTGPGATERPQETSGAPSLGCEEEVQPRSVKWLRRKRRLVFENCCFPIGLPPRRRVWMRCENEKCFNPSHMELITVWEMGRRYQKKVATPAKERRKW